MTFTFVIPLFIFTGDKEGAECTEGHIVRELRVLPTPSPQVDILHWPMHGHQTSIHSKLLDALVSYRILDASLDDDWLARFIDLQHNHIHRMQHGN